MATLLGGVLGAAWRPAVGLALTTLALAGPAAASCPPFDVERTGLGYLGLEQQRRLTPADREAILKGGVIPGVPVGLWPFSGPAPLRVGLVWLIAPEGGATIELDVDGDGTPEIVDTRIGEFGHVYATPGRYAATVTVRRPGAAAVTYATPVVVLSTQDFERELQARWATFTSGLARRDLEGVLDCLHSARRQELEHQVRALMGPDTAGKLPGIRFIELRVMEAVCRATVPVPGMAGPLEVRFGMDFDGVWRIASLDVQRDRP